MLSCLYVKKILITGAEGVIGAVLVKNLKEDHKIVELDLPSGDVRDYDFLLDKVKGADVVIHVAHSADPKMRENWRSGRIDPSNVLMEMNVFDAVLRTGVKRLIMASSVHADSFTTYKGGRPLKVPGSYSPTSPYGGHKLILEEMGRFYANHHKLEFIAIRFGGVTPDNSVKKFGKEKEVWLSHEDLTKAVRACITADSVPDNFVVFYAVSNNTGRLHDISNPFGWKPKDNSSDYLK